jgi:diadenylate cyclase
VVGAIILYLLYVLAQALDLHLLSGIMQAGAVVGLLALVVIFQPELRRGLDRLGRVGSMAWLSPSDAAGQQRAAGVLAKAAALLASQRVGALVVVERETGLGDMAETGVPIDGQLSVDLVTTLFSPGSALHDGAVIVSGERIVAAGVMLPLSEALAERPRFGTRHRAALGITEQTDALAVVVSEEAGSMGLAEGGAIVTDLTEEGLRQRLLGALRPVDVPGRARSIARSGGRRLRGKRPRGAQAQRGRPPATVVTASTSLPAGDPSAGVAGPAETPGRAVGAGRVTAPATPAPTGVPGVGGAPGVPGVHGGRE